MPTLAGTAKALTVTVAENFSLFPNRSRSQSRAYGVTDPLAHAPLHDDWALSAALCALLDKHVSLSQGLSFVIPAPDPLANLRW